MFDVRLQVFQADWRSEDDASRKPYLISSGFRSFRPLWHPDLSLAQHSWPPAFRPDRCPSGTSELQQSMRQTYVKAKQENVPAHILRGLKKEFENE